MAVIHRPLRLSGRRCQRSARTPRTSPINRSTTSTAAIAACPSEHDRGEHGQLGQPGRHPRAGPRASAAARAEPAQQLAATTATCLDRFASHPFPADIARRPAARAGRLCRPVDCRPTRTAERSIRAAPDGLAHPRRPPTAAPRQFGLVRHAARSSSTTVSARAAQSAPVEPVHACPRVAPDEAQRRVADGPLRDVEDRRQQDAPPVRRNSQA